MASLEELRDVAALAAETGGRIVRAGAGRGAEASEKGLPGDYVTEVDLASERAIREVLEQATSGIPVLGEDTDWSGGPGYLAGDILAGDPAVHTVLLEVARRSAP